MPAPGVRLRKLSQKSASISYHSIYHTVMPLNDRPIADQTLNELEGFEWEPPTFESALVTNIHRLRRLPLKQYRMEDLRLMIGQQIGLDYLVPPALDDLL